MGAFKYVEIVVYSVIYDPSKETYEANGSVYIREPRTNYNWNAVYQGRDWAIGFEQEPLDDFMKDIRFTRDLLSEIKNSIGYVDLPKKRIVTIEV